MLTLGCGGSKEHAALALAGTAVNQDGRSSSLTAPNGPSQQAVMRLALRGGTVRGDQMAALQMHGTGTSLGDPIEVGAALAVLGRADGAPLTLEAVKSYVGHTETAAGVIGLAQPLEGIARMCTSKVLHLTAINPPHPQRGAL